MKVWEKILSKKYGKYYLYNTQTGKSMWPSKLRGGAEEDDSNSDLDIDTDPVVSIQQQLDKITLTPRDIMTGSFGRISNNRPSTPHRILKLPFKTPRAYPRKSLHRTTDPLMREDRMQIDQPPIFRPSLQPHQLPAPRINIPRQTHHFSDRELEILLRTGELPARQEARPPYPAQFRAYLDLMASGAPYRAPPTPEPRPFNPDLPEDPRQPNRQARQDAFRAHLDQMAMARGAPPDHPRRPNPVIRRPPPAIYRRR